MFICSHTLSLTKPPEVNTPASSNATRTLFCRNNPHIKCKQLNNMVYYNRVARGVLDLQSILVWNLRLTAVRNIWSQLAQISSCMILLI